MNLIDSDKLAWEANMLTLYLLRHAKSSWAKPFSRDIERSLNERGIADAPRMGRHIAALPARPALILCSPARRTRETLDLVLPELGADNPAIVMSDQLYHGGAQDYLDLIKSRGGQAGCVLVIGHNPSIEELAAMLAERGGKGARAALAQKYPTAALAVLTFDEAAWSAIAPGAGTLQSFTTPAMLPS